MQLNGFSPTARLFFPVAKPSGALGFEQRLSKFGHVRGEAGSS
jgi:hypothetical protein